MGVRDGWNLQGRSDSRIRAGSSFGEAVRVGETALCLDCLVTFSVRNRTCPKCGSEQFWLMAKWKQTPVRTRPVAVAFPKDRAARGRDASDTRAEAPAGRARPPRQLSA
jgi:hypothetical protein